MDFDYPLILVVAVLITGLAWGLMKFKFAAESKTLEFFGSFFPVLAVVLVLRSFLFEPFQIPSGSMIPTLKVGDFILVNKYAYGLRLPVSGTKFIDVDDPKRGDVMVFFPPNDERYFIKRVIGLPGDKIEVKNGRLFVNGQMMIQTKHETLRGDPTTCTHGRVASCTVQVENLDGVEHLIQREINPLSRVSKNFSATVPQGHYFMMGDNRDNSNDSRTWHSVPEENIVGKAVAVWMHWDEFFSLPSFETAGAIK